MVALLLVRTEDNSRRVLNAVQQRLGRSVDHVISPVLRIVDLPVSRPQETELILTSPEGVRRAVETGAAGRAWCVGDGTARMARAAGFETVVGDGDGPALLALILRDPPAAPLVHITGRYQAVDFAAALKGAGVPCRTLIAYDQCAEPLSDPARAVLQGENPVVLPLFSPRTTRILLQQDIVISAPVTYVAISQAAAAGVRDARVAAAPSLDAMIAAIAAALLHPVAS